MFWEDAFQLVFDFKPRGFSARDVVLIVGPILKMSGMFYLLVNRYRILGSNLAYGDKSSITWITWNQPPSSSFCCWNLWKKIADARLQYLFGAFGKDTMKKYGNPRILHKYLVPACNAVLPWMEECEKLSAATIFNKHRTRLLHPLAKTRAWIL